MRGSWLVQYQDGELLAQHDTQHPLAVSGEVPFRAIEWPRVATVRFESQDARTTLDIPEAPDGYSWSLRSRNWMRVDGQAVSAFLLILSDRGVEVNHDSTAYVLYWYPDGTVHESPFFTSKETDEYGSGILHGQGRALGVRWHGRCEKCGKEWRCRPSFQPTGATKKVTTPQATFDRRT